MRPRKLNPDMIEYARCGFMNQLSVTVLVNDDLWDFRYDEKTNR